MNFVFIALSYLLLFIFSIISIILLLIFILTLIPINIKITASCNSCKQFPQLKNVNYKITITYFFNLLKMKFENDTPLTYKERGRKIKNDSKTKNSIQIENLKYNAENKATIKMGKVKLNLVNKIKKFEKQLKSKKSKSEYYISIWSNYPNKKKLIIELKNTLLKILKNIKVKQFQLDGIVGISNKKYIGYLYGLVSFIKPFSNETINIEMNMDEEIYEFDLILNSKISIIHIIICILGYTKKIFRNHLRYLDMTFVQFIKTIKRKRR